MNKILECHKLLGVHLNASFPSSKLFRANVQLYHDILCNLQQIIKPLILPLLIMLQDIVLLYLICLLANDESIVLSIIYAYNFNVVFVNCHALVHGIDLLSRFNVILPGLELAIDRVLVSE